MSISSTGQAFRKNSKLKPTFSKNTPVILNKDYTQFDHVFSKFLTKNAVGQAMYCGSSLYAYDPGTRRYNTLIDGEEWCFLEIETPLFEEYLEDSSGWVKAKDLTDLRTLSTEELAKI